MLKIVRQLMRSLRQQTEPYLGISARVRSFERSKSPEEEEGSGNAHKSDDQCRGVSPTQGRATKEGSHGDQQASAESEARDIELPHSADPIQPGRDVGAVKLGDRPLPEPPRSN